MQVRIDQIDDNIFKYGIFPTIDTILEKQKSEMEKLEKVASHIDSLFDKKNGSISSIGYLESEGYSISLTRNRFTMIEEKLKKSFVTIDGKHHFFKDFRYQFLKNSVN